MGDNVVDLADRRPDVFYVIRIRHGWDGSISCVVEGLSEDKEARRRTAAAVREAADQIEHWDIEVVKR